MKCVMQMLEYTQFLEYIQANIEDYLEDIDIEKVELISRVKNNGVSLDALALRLSDSRTDPVVYLQPFYEKYRLGSSMELIMEELSDALFRNLYVPSQIQRIDAADFSNVKDNIFLRAVNFERNRAMLPLCPYRRVLNLALTYRIYFGLSDGGLTSMLVDNDTAAGWHKDTQALYELAMENTKRLFPARIGSMQSMIGCAVPGLSEEDMYVLSNTSGINGATAAFYPGLLKQFADEAGTDFYLLPSSIHEMILLPESGQMRPESLLEIVRQANREVVNQEDILADNVYTYHAKNDEISIYI